MSGAVQAFIRISVFAFTSIGGMVGIAHGREPPYFGMSETQLQTCKKLGKQVVAAQEAGPDSTEHEWAYELWDKSCGMEVMLQLVKKYNLSHVPASPQEWAEMK